ncbi:MAG: alpha-L-fucosidase [Clostridia bacterium]|nr:alpha-L-fucosidase [Clostridia bacterium]
MNIKKEQLEFLDWEMGVFFHFGIRTFYEGHVDWDMKEMPAEGFNPTSLDCEDWIKTAHDAGAKYAILVTKHHDGFANWPSKYTDYSVKNTPWKNGKGDVVKEFTDACRKYGMKVGLYYSPAQFGSVKMNPQEYDDYFINQVSELLTNYGRIDYIWFDGCGSEEHKYDEQRIVDVIRSLQPGILIFNMWDPDTRWVGNESGVAPSPSNLTVSELEFSVLTEEKAALNEAHFLPVECDCMMRLDNWFYSDSDEDTVKSVDELMGLYYYSVGRGANLLINIGPDRRGLLPDKDKESLLHLGEAVRRLKDAEIPCEREEKSETSFDIVLEQQPVNNLVLTEEIDGETEIGEFEIKVHPYSYGAPITVFRGTTIGHKAICPFPTIRTKRITVTFDKPKKVEAKPLYLPLF